MKPSALVTRCRMGYRKWLPQLLLGLAAIAFGFLTLPSADGGNGNVNVSISAVTPSIPVTAGSTYAFTITRDDSKGPLTVAFLTSGAVEGTDYTVDSYTQGGDTVNNLAGFFYVTFPNKTLTETFSITPQNPLLTPSTGMVWQLYPIGGYNIVNAQATVTLTSVPPATVTFAGINGVTSFSETATNVPAFAQVVRSAAAAQPLTVYLVNTTTAAQLGGDYTCPALTPVSGFVGVYSVTIPSNQTTVQLTASPIADWTPEGNQTFGYTLLTRSNPAWQNLSPQPGYPSPTNASEVQVTVLDVNINASVTLTNPTTTQGQNSNPPTLTFTRDVTPINSIIYFSLTSSQSGNLNQQIQVQGANFVNGSTSTYSVQLNGTATTASVQILPKNGTGAGFTTTITAQILGSTDPVVGSQVRYAVASPSSQTISILNAYPTVSLQVLQPIVYQNDQTANVIAVNRTSQGLANPLTVTLTQTASQARVVYDYYLLDNLGNNISNPASFTLTFPAGVSQILIGMQGVANGQVEPNQLVAWQLASSSNYAPTTTQANILLISTTIQVLNPGLNAVFTLDFEHGMEGATSNYFVAPITNPVNRTLYPEGDYIIGSNPNTYHDQFYSLFDHTFGSAAGHMMIVNGAPDVGTLLLGFTIYGLSPSQPYYVNYYGTSVNPASPALMQVTVNGQMVGQAHFEAAAGWHQYTYVFNTDANGNAAIQFINLNTQRSGNDFALDDITLGTYTTKTNLPGVDISQTPSTIPEYTPPPASGSYKIFTVTRDRDSTPNAPERIYLTQTAQTLVQAFYGTDYTSTQLQFDPVNNVYYVDLPVGQLAVDVYITPVDNWIPGPDKGLGYRLLTFTDPAWATLTPFYYPSNGSPAQVTIQNVSINATVTAVTPNLFENQPSSSQVFAVNRDKGGQIAGNVYLALNSANTAKMATNFTWTGATLDPATGLYYVAFAAGQTQAFISIQPVATGVIGPDLTLGVQVVDGTDSRLTNAKAIYYRTGSPSSATAYLHQTSTVVNLVVLLSAVTQGQGSTPVLQIQGPSTAGGLTRVYLALNPSGTTAVYPGAFTTSDLTYDAVSGYFYVDINFSTTPTKSISITPDDWVVQPSRTLGWMLVGPAAVQSHGFVPAYQLGSNTTGTVTILPNSVVATLTPQGSTTLLRNVQPAAPGTIANVARNRTGKAQTIYVQVSGTAVSGTDYTLNTLSLIGTTIAVPFGVNDQTVPIAITTIDNWLMENNPTLQFQVVTDSTVTGTTSTYAVGTPSASLMTLADVPDPVSIQTVLAPPQLRRTDPTTRPVFLISRGRTGKAQSVWFSSGNSPLIVYYPGVPATAVVPYDLSVATDSGAVLTGGGNNFLVNFGANVGTVTIQAAPNAYFGSPTVTETYAVTLQPQPTAPMYTLSGNLTALVSLLGYAPPTIGVIATSSPASYGGPPGAFTLTLSGPAPPAAFNLSFTLGGPAAAPSSGPATSRYFASYNGNSLYPNSGVTATTPSASVFTETGMVQLVPGDWNAATARVISINLTVPSAYLYLPPAILTLTLTPNAYYTFAGQDPKNPSANPPSASIMVNGYGAPPVAAKITAALISGSTTDPMRILDPGPTLGVTVTGALVAGGAPGAGATPALPAPGMVMLKADPNLLDGAVVPPIVPMVMDLRISQITSSTLPQAVTPTGWQSPGATPVPGATPKPVMQKPTPF